MLGIMTLDQQGIIQTYDATTASMFGYGADELIGQHLTFLLSSASQETITAERHDHLTAAACWPALTGCRKNGSTFPLELLLGAYPTADRPTRVAMVRDLTNAQARQEETLKAQTLEVIATLAGGIAHSFNNILTAILGNVSLAKAYVAPDTRISERLSSAETACQRAADLAQQLLTFAQGGVPTRKATTISNVITDAIDTALKGAKAVCQLSLADDLWLADIDGRQVRHVLHNVLSNAVQAMPQGGTIKVDVENLTVTSAQAASLAPGNYVQISIEDEGDGIPPEHLKKVFDPFFTTKPPGYGLGLAIAHSIVAKHQGTITLDSAVGIGTTCILCLPAMPVAAVPRGRQEPPQAPQPARILVMDDESMIRELLQLTLSRLGYEVECVSNGADAIAAYQQSKIAGQPYDAVILDLLIPVGLGGLDTVARLREIEPQVKAIVCSGYANDPVLSQHSQYGFKAALLKPFNIEDLQEVIENVLQDDA